MEAIEFGRGSEDSSQDRTLRQVRGHQFYPRNFFTSHTFRGSTDGRNEPRARLTIEKGYMKYFIKLCMIANPCL